MTEQLLDKFRKGSYKGVDFDVFKIGHTQVKKNKEHQFSNTDRRYIEERGVQGKDFECTISVFGNGSTFLDKRDKLRKVLAEEGSGLLVLPFEGEFYAKCTAFSDDTNIIDNIGRSDFTVSFKVTKPKEQNGNPVEVTDDKVALAEKTNKAKSIVTAMTNNNLSISSALNYGGVLGKLTSMSNMVGGTLGNVANSAGMALSLSSFKSGLASMMSGGAVGTGIGSLFNVFETFSSDASSLFASSQSMFSFGNDDVSVSQITPERTESAVNSQVLNTQVQVTAVSMASNAVADIEFSNTEDLNNAGTAIKEQIQKTLTSDIVTNPNISGSSELAYALKELLIAIDNIIASKSVDTPNLVTIKASNTSMSMIAYQYYDSVDDVSSLLELNKMSRATITSGEIRIFSDV